MKLFFGLLLFCHTAFAANLTEETLMLAEDYAVTFRHSPADEGKPTHLLLNGYLHSLDGWNAYISELQTRGHGVVVVAYSVQPESFEKLGDVRPHFMRVGNRTAQVDTQTFVNEAKAVTDYLSLERVSVHALSYSSFVGVEFGLQFPDLVDRLFLLAPAIVPSSHHNVITKARLHWYRSQLPLTNFLYQPERLYNLEIYEGVKFLFSDEMRAVADKHGISVDLVHNGLFQMSQAIKWSDLVDYSNDRLPPITMVVADNEYLDLKKDQRRFWDALERNPARQKLVTVKSGHVITSDAPTAVAKATAGSKPKKVGKQQSARETHIQSRRSLKPAKLSCRQAFR